MRRLRFAMVVPVLALGLGLTGGCSEEPKEVPFKETNTKQFDQMKEMMINKMAKKAPPGAPKPKPAAAPESAPTPAPAEK